MISRTSKFLLLILVAAQVFSPALAVAQPQGPEFRLKAVFLFNFAQFVDWPAEAFPTPQSPLVVGVLGPDPFGRVLDETLENEVVNSHPLQVRRFKTVDEVRDCHILYINATPEQLEPILLKLRGKSILTVSDLEGFATTGGMIRFTTEKNKIRFRINVEATEAANLKVSSKLLRVAEIISTDKER